METTKILFALVFGFAGFWIFTQFSNQEARHILISNTAAHVMDNGLIALTFGIENTGAPDRVVSASSTQGDVSLTQTGGIIVPGGTSALSLESAHLLMQGGATAPEPGTLLPISLVLQSAGTVSAVVKVTETPAMLHGTMIHGAMQIDMGDPPPSIALKAQNTEDGWQIQIETSDFEFNAKAVDQAHVPGEGHGHLYVSGTRIGRVFQDVVTLADLPKGSHTVQVTLNTNNHIAYLHDGKIVSASTVIQVD